MTKTRYFVNVTGIVQGVGYRPFVYNQASLFHIKGWVSNHGGMLVMDIEGEKEELKYFLLKVTKEPPPLAVINKVNVNKLNYMGFEDFKILPSQPDHQEIKFFSYDVSTCPDCLRDFLDSNNRRFHYPFTNCTSCGPRYTIIKSLPYDRINTTMSKFNMCPICLNEYNDPQDRRFHAQPNCCPSCGPHLKLFNHIGEEIIFENVVSETIRLLKSGCIIAIKGLGGFHLACDAMNEKAIDLLRQRKNRPHKPLAMMMKDLNLIKKLCKVSQEEENILTSNKSPIVILKKKNIKGLPTNIAPNVNTMGIMLPYTPLHHVLFESDIQALVMTSANLSSSPIQFINQNAMNELRQIADYFLVHNRDIHISIEDSVVKVVQGREMVVRRARGYSPYTIHLKISKDILALGSEEKGNFSLSQKGFGYLSQYLGNLKDYDALSNYNRVINHFTNTLEVNPQLIAHDLQMKPNYKGEKYVPIQHHHAHMVSCMVEHRLYEKSIGVIFDGTGLGTDGTIWGGDILLGNRECFIRVGHFKPVLIQGGDSSIRDIWKIACSYLYSMNVNPKNWIKNISDDEFNVISQALKNQFNCYYSSSVGRLFDCISVLLNICHKTTYQAQGAIELESIINPTITDVYPYIITYHDGVFQVDYQDLIKSILKDIELEVPKSDISAMFHNTIGMITIDLVNKISQQYHINDVILSGGVFENHYLLSYVLNGTKDSHLKVYYNQQIPINDGGISIGQLAIAAALEGE